MVDCDSFIHNIRAEIMKAYAEVFSAETSDVIRGQSDGAHVVFKRTTTNNWSGCMKGEAVVF